MFNFHYYNFSTIILLVGLVDPFAGDFVKTLTSIGTLYLYAQLTVGDAANTIL